MKKKISSKKREKAAIAISQIFILVIATIAFSWMIGSTIEEVSAAGSDGTCTGTCIDTNTQQCSIPVADNLCPGGNNIKCCTGVVSNCYTQHFCSNGATYPGHLVGSSCVANTLVTGVSCPSGQCNGNECLATVSNNGGGTNILQTVTNLGTAATATKGTIDLSKKIVNGAKNILNGGSTGGSAVVAGENAANLGGTLTTLSGQAASNVAGIPAGPTSSSTSWVLGGNTAIGEAGAVVVWAAIAFVIGRYVLGPVFGLDTQQSQSLGWALAAGTGVGVLLTSDALMGLIGASAVGGPIGLAIGAAVAFVMFAILGKKSSVDMIMYNCLQWEAPSGKGLTPTQMTQRCKMCNDQKDFVCTDYQCKSLGQGCVLINNADEGTQLCIWNNTQDILPPMIKPWKEALIPDEYAYTPDSAIGPTSKGVRVNYIGTQKVTTDGTAKCAPPFTPISFGVELNEPAKCKIAAENAPSYAEMADAFMGNGLRKYNHSFIFSLPSAEAIAAENATVVENGGKYEMYVRCEDANGNANVASFEFKFCISQGPDVTPPLMIGTSIVDNTPIRYNQSIMPVELYVTDQTFTKANASCRWSHTDRNYNAMEYNMSCGHSILNMNAQLAYTCNATLTGLKDNQDNKIYFRCIDDLGNSNTQSRVLTLIGTTPLTITSVGPAGIIEGPSEVVGVNLTVETASGYDDGKAVCAFSPTKNSGSFIDFFYGYDVEPFSQSIHSQELGLSAGNYTYFLQCRDMGGNIVEKNVSFTVRVDDTPPMIVRVYKDEGLNALKVITSETAECVYDNFGCDYLFSNGTAMNTNDGIEHYVEWNSALDFYIKCKDKYGKIPPEGECSLIARPFDIAEAQ